MPIAPHARPASAAIESRPARTLMRRRTATATATTSTASTACGGDNCRSWSVAGDVVPAGPLASGLAEGEVAVEVVALVVGHVERLELGLHIGTEDRELARLRGRLHLIEHVARSDMLLPEPVRDAECGIGTGRNARLAADPLGRGADRHVGDD